MPEQTAQLPVQCFAPPLTDALLAEYETLINGLSAAQAELRDIMQECLTCVKLWWSLPESKRTDGPNLSILHRGKLATIPITPLEESHVKSLDSVTPWMRECRAMGEVIQQLPAGVREVPATTETSKGTTRITRNEVVDEKAFKLKNAASHLLWFTEQLALDREPPTSNILLGS